MAWEEVKFGSEGGRCAGRLHRADAEHAPCVVLANGLSCVMDQGLDAFAERLAAAGLHALAFDYRYMGESAGEPRGLVRFASQRADIDAALRFAAEAPGVDPSALALWGYSLGGGHAQVVAASDASIAAAIFVAPVVDSLRTLLHIGGLPHVARMLGAGARDRARALRGADPHRIQVTPPGRPAVLDTPDSPPGFEAITPPDSGWRNEICARAVFGLPYRLGRSAGRIRCPALYCIATDDDVNPPALGIKAADRAPQGELRLYPGGHYDPFQGETLERMASDQISFLHRVFTNGAAG